MFQIIVVTGGIDYDHFSNQESYVTSSYGFLNVDVINQGNVLQENTILRIVVYQRNLKSLNKKNIISD